MPEQGYTPIIAAMLDHPRISLSLNTRFERPMAQGFDHVFYSGPLDSWFGQDAGALGYRTLDFERLTHDGDYQGCAVMNYADADVPHTRITEHKYFAPWEDHTRTICYRETSRACGPADIPYYPIRLAEDKALLSAYIACAQAERGCHICGASGHLSLSGYGCHHPRGAGLRGIVYGQHCAGSSYARFFGVTMIPDRATVCAIVVTFNRLAQLRQTLAHLLAEPFGPHRGGGQCQHRRHRCLFARAEQSPP